MSTTARGAGATTPDQQQRQPHPHSQPPTAAAAAAAAAPSHPATPACTCTAVAVYAPSHLQLVAAGGGRLVLRAVPCNPPPPAAGRGRGRGGACGRAPPAAHRLPLETVPTILQFMDAADLRAAACVSSAWQTMAEHDHLWDRLCAVRWGIRRCGLVASALSPKQLYHMLLEGWLHVAADAMGRAGELEGPGAGSLGRAHMVQARAAGGHV